MKNLFICVFGLWAISSTAQLTHNQSIGAFSIGGGGSGNGLMSPAKSSQPEFRKFDGKFCRSDQWALMTGELGYKEDDGILIVFRGFNRTHPIAVKNYTDHVSAGSSFTFRATFAGGYNWNNEPLDLYDCGSELTKTESAQALSEYCKNEAAEQAAAKAAQEKANAEAKAKAIAQKQAAAARALKANQDAAAKGDSFGLMRMGERYRDGDGVEKDLVKARDYFEKSFAADTNNFIAKEKLSKLSSQ
jgi:hypothetical protein